MRGILVVLLAAVVASPAAVFAEGAKLIKVAVEFRQSGRESRDAVQGSGRVVITEGSGARSRARLGVESTETRVVQSTGVFTVVEDGGESTLTVATQVPYPEVVFYRDYAVGAGYVATGVAFKDVGTALKVRATVLAGNRVRVRLTPTISYFSADGSGTIEFTEASTELVVPSGRPVALGGATSETHALTREILGFRASQASRETSAVLTATIQ